MENIKQKILKFRPYLFIFLTLVVLVLGLVLRRQSQKPTPIAPTASTEPKPQEVVADWGKLSDLVSNLGDPISGPVQGTKQGVYEYKSPSVNLNNEVQYVQGVPIFYKQVIGPDEKKTATSIKKQFGDPEIVLYGGFSEMGLYLYAYPSKGVAYIGSSTKDLLLEVWYFAPTDTSTFISKWAPDYSLTPTEGGF